MRPTRNSILFLSTLFFLVFCALSQSSFAQGTKTATKKIDPLANKPIANVVFKSKKLDFGTVSGDTTLTAIYHFQNTSKNPLIFAYVNPDCTCTSYEVSSKNIAPGKKGWIKLIFATKNKTGKQAIYAVASSNTPEKFHKLVLLCNIK